MKLATKEDLVHALMFPDHNIAGHRFTQEILEAMVPSKDAITINIELVVLNNHRKTSCGATDDTIKN